MDEDRAAAKEDARDREGREWGVELEREGSQSRERCESAKSELPPWEEERGREEREKKGEREKKREREVAGVGAPPFFRIRQPHVWRRVCVCTRTCASVRACEAGV